MSLATQLRVPNVALKVYLYFDNFLNGGRRSLLWNDPQKKDYSSSLVSLAKIEHRTETTLHSFVTSDLSVVLHNIPTTNGGVGFWDSDWTTFDLKPLESILMRVAISVQEANGSWGTITPVFTGMVEDLYTDNRSGQANLQAIGLASFLVQESAEDVKDGDSWYRQIPINQAVKLLLTQKDRWCTTEGRTSACTVTAVGPSGSPYIEVQRDSGNFFEDYAYFHPLGVHAGYIIRMTSGSASGKELVIYRNYLSTAAGGGFRYSQCWVTADPVTLGIQSGDSCSLTGMCWPFTQTEIAGFDIEPVTRIPTADGRPAVSVFGRPPENGTNAVCEGLCHTDTYLYLGIGNSVYRYDPATDTYLFIAFLGFAASVRRLYYYNSYVYALVWANLSTSSTTTLYIFRFQDSIAPGTMWYSTDAWKTFSSFYPGNFHSSRGYTDGTTRRVGQKYGSTPYAPNVPIVIPQSLRAVDVTGTVTNARYLYYAVMNNYVGTTWNSWSSYPVLPVTEPWTYVSAELVGSGSAPSALFQYTIGGKYLLVWNTSFATTDARGLYFWTYNGTGTYTLNCLQMTGAVITLNTTTGYNCPVAMFDHSISVYSLVQIQPDLGTVGANAWQSRLIFARSTDGVTGTVWTTTDGYPWKDYLWVDACSGGTYAVGCVLMANSSYDGTGARFNQKYVLVKNITSSSFLTSFDANILYSSRAPFTHFHSNQNLSAGFFHHYGYGTLWYSTAGVTGMAPEFTGNGPGYQSYNNVTVPGDRTMCSQMTFTSGTYFSVFGVSSGDWVWKDSFQVNPTGQCYLWQFARELTPRIDVFDLQGLTRWKALCLIAELANYLCYFDELGSLVFKPRVVGAPYEHTVTDDDGITRAVKRTVKAEAYNRFECTPYVPQFDPAKVTYVAATVDADGQPVSSLIFNGDIWVKQVGFDTKRIVLICAKGNASRYNVSVGPITDTWWFAFCPSESPQYGNNAATQYTGGWWNVQSWDVWVKLEAAASDARGFMTGDRIVIDTRGVNLEQKGELKTFVDLPNTTPSRKTSTYTINNKFVTPQRARNLCQLYANAYGALPIQVEVEGELFTPYMPLDTMSLTLARLNLGAYGFLKSVGHQLMGTPTSTFVFRKWDTPGTPTQQALATPVVPFSEPLDAGEGLAPPGGPEGGTIGTDEG